MKDHRLGNDEKGEEHRVAFSSQITEGEEEEEEEEEGRETKRKRAN